MHGMARHGTSERNAADTARSGPRLAPGPPGTREVPQVPQVHQGRETATCVSSPAAVEMKPVLLRCFVGFPQGARRGCGVAAGGRGGGREG